MAAAILPRRSEPARTLKCSGRADDARPREPAPISSLRAGPAEHHGRCCVLAKPAGEHRLGLDARRSSSSWSPRTGPGTRVLRSLLFGPGFRVAADACTAEAAEAAVVAHQPDAVLLDLAPDSGGIEAIERIMGTCPTPIVVCGEMAPHAPDALAAGAVDVIGELDASPTLTAVRQRGPAPRAGRLAGAGHHPSAQPAARPRCCPSTTGRHSCRCLDRAPVPPTGRPCQTSG